MKEKQTGGIRKRVSKTGRISYQAIIHWRGSNGPGFYSVTKSRERDASSWRRETLVALESGALLKRDGTVIDAPAASAVDPEPARAKLVDLIADWYSDKLRRDRAEATINEARKFIAVIPGRWLESPAADVSEQVSQCWFDWLSQTGPVWANRNLRFIRNVYNIAVRRRLVGSNPFARIEQHAEKRRDRRLRRTSNVDERRAILLAALRYGRPSHRLLSPVYVALVLLLEQALRRSDVRRLRWEDLDLDHAAAVLPTSKTGPRIFPLSRRSRRLLARWRVQCGHVREGWVFTDPANRERPLWSYDSLTRAFVKVRRRAGLGSSGLHLHDLKHESLSTWAEKGLALPDLRALSGNSFKTLEIYVQSGVAAVAGRLHAADEKPLVEVPPLRRGRKGERG